MILLICITVMIVCGLILTIKPTTGVNKDKLKEGVTYEDAVKRNRISGIAVLVSGLLILIVSLL